MIHLARVSYISQEQPRRRTNPCPLKYSNAPRYTGEFFEKKICRDYESAAIKISFLHSRKEVLWCRKPIEICRKVVTHICSVREKEKSRREKVTGVGFALYIYAYEREKERERE